MKQIFLITVVFLTLVSCKKDGGAVDFKPITKLVSYKTDGENLILKSGNSTNSFSLSSLPLKKVVILNASLIGYISELGLEDRIVGVSSPEYIFSPIIKRAISQNKIQNVGNEQKYDVEKIIALKPDAVFTNYVSTFQNFYQILQKQGIKIVFLDEYKEQNPLEKSSYLKVFGLLFNKNAEADIKFNEIKANYQNLKNLALKANRQPVVITNEMYGNQWFLPGGKTAFANFMRDANAEYILKNNESSEAVPMSFEEVLSKSSKSEFWVNAGNHSTKKQMLSINPNYTKISAFSHGKIYAVTAKEINRANDYFESGVVRSDLVLHDYVTIFHPELFPNGQLIYLKEIH